MSDELPEIDELTHTAAVNRQKDIRDEMRRLVDKDELVPEDELYLADLETEFDRLDDHRKKLERKALMARVDVVTGKKLTVEKGSADLDADLMRDEGGFETPSQFKNPWDLSEIRRFAPPSAQSAELRSRALTAVERMRGINDKRRSVITSMIEESDDEISSLADHVLRTSSPEYMRAFKKFVKTGGRPQYEPDEAKAVERAMSLTTTAGGFLLPTQLDPTVIITSDGTFNQVRQFARNVVATSNIWYGVSAPYASWSVDAEAAQVSDDTPTFAQPSVTIYKLAGFIPISVEALQDEQNVTNEIGRILAMGKDNLEMQLFATGTGSSQHTGIAVGVAAVTASRVASITADTLGIEDVYAIDTALPARYRGNAGWLMHRYTANAIRQFDTAGGAGMWVRIGENQPDQLIGKPVFEAESMDGAITGAADNDLIVYGDRDSFVVADRLGMVVEPIQHLFQQTTAGTGFGAPTGQRGFYAYARSGSNVVNAGGLRILRV